MGPEGLAAVQARISELRGQLGLLAPPAPAPAPPTGAGSFQSVLASAMAGGGVPGLGGPTATATVKAPGDYGALTPPAELAAYGNGRIPPDQLVPIGNGSERLHAPAAEAFKRMTSDAWRAGVDLKVNDGYRSLDGQHAMAEELGLYSQGGKAAVPGTSTHGWGLSVDIDNQGGAHEWLRSNAHRYGFVEDVPGEPWHWTFRPDGA